MESISHITAETLYACHKAFYDPANMVLCVAGNVDPEQICADGPGDPARAGRAPIARGDYGAAGARRRAAQIRRRSGWRSPLPSSSWASRRTPPRTGEEGLRQQLLGELACEALLGNSSPLYARLYREGLINQNFSYGYESYPGCAFLCAGGESQDPEAVRAAVAGRGGADRAGRASTRELWERLKKGAYGSRGAGPELL